MVSKSNKRAESHAHRRPSRSAVLVLALVAWGLVWAGRLPAQTPEFPLLTNISQVRALTRDQAASHRPVAVRGVVTYCEPSGWMLFIQDAGDAVYVGYSNKTVAVLPGDWVEVRGLSHPGVFNPCVADAELTVLGRRERLPALPVTLKDMTDGKLDGRWVQLTGVIHRAAANGDKLQLELAVEGGSLPVTVANVTKKKATGAALVDAVVQVQGVCGVEFGGNEKVTGGHIYVPSLAANVTVLEPPRSNVLAEPFQLAANLPTLAAAPGLTRRVWVRGLWLGQTNDLVWLQDSSGVVCAQSVQSVPGRPGEKVEAAGFSARNGTGVWLEDALVQIMGRPLTNDPPAPDGLLPVLCSIEDINELPTSAAARRGHPVRLRGVVTYADSSLDRVFVQDETGGIAVLVPEGAVPVEFRQGVEVDGFTGVDGRRTFVVQQARWRVWQTNAPLPQPRVATIVDFARGRVQNAWVQVAGLVQGLTNRGSYVDLNVRLDGGELHARSPQGHFPPLEDREAVVTGVANAQWDVQGRPVELRLFVPAASHIELPELAKATPFSLPSTPVRYLSQRGNPAWNPLKRVKARGVVTAQRLGESLFLYDGLDTLFVTSAQRTPLQPGDVVEVAGWPVANAFSAELEDAIFRPLAQTRPLPQPRAVGVKEALAGQCDAQLVQMEGRLLEMTAREGRPCLVLQAEAVFDAILETPGQEARLRTLEPGCRLRVTGVCSVLIDKNNQPKSFFLHLRTADDVQVVTLAPWWSFRRALRWGAMMALVVLVALGWGLLQRRRVEKQQGLLRLHARQQETLSDLGYHLSLAATSREAARVIADTADELLGWDAFAVDLYVSERNQMRPLLAIDVIDGRRQEATDQSEFLEPSPRFQRVLEQGPFLHEASQTGTLALDARPFGDKARPSACILYAPIRNGTKITGLLSIHSYQSGAYDEANLKLLQSLADHCAGALERIQAEENLRHANEELEERVRRRTAELSEANESLRREIAERQQAEAARRESEQRYATFADLLPVCIYSKDLEGRFTFVNAQFCRELGQPKEDIIGKTDYDFSPPELAQKYRRGDQCVIDTRQRLEIVEEHHAGPDGRPSYIQIVKFPVFNTSGELLGTQGVWWDATERRKAELALARAHAELEQRVAERTEELSCANTRLTQEIAERKQIEAALRQAEGEMEKLANFARFNPNPVFEFAADGRLTYFNESARHMARILKKQHPAEFLPPDVVATVRACLATGESKLRQETRLGPRTLSWSFFPIQPSQVVHCYAGDVTERLNLEAQFRQSQKMESVGRLAGGVAHDFNNILTVIQGHAGLLESGMVAAHRITESAAEITKAAERAAHLIRQLLTFSRKQPMQLGLVDLNEAVSNLSGMIGRLIGEDVALHVHFATHPPVARADQGMIDQVLLNLAVNARDAMPNGGHLTVRLETLVLAASDLRSHPEGRAGSFVCLSATDTGCGMTEEVLAHLFEPFFTTKGVGKGTGLGLATVYGIVQEHSGWIEVTSAPGQGASFRVYLPRMDGPSPPPPRPEEPETLPGGNETILVVEDEQPVRELVCRVLRSYGYRVLVAESGVAALQVWQEHHASINLVMTDIVMPEGLSGLELAERLQAEKPGVKIILSSGYSLDEAPEGLEPKPGLAFLPKPYQVGTLVHTVRQCLDMRPAAGPG